MFGKRARRSRQGKRASAVVLSAEQGHFVRTAGTPEAMNSTEQSWRLRLRVEPDGEAPFEAGAHAYLSQLDNPQPGRRFMVRYDPADRAEVTIDQGEGAALDAMAHRVASTHPGADPAALADLVRKRAADPHAVSAADIAAAIPGASVLGSGQPPAPPAGSDPVELLAKLTELHDRGILSDAEFRAQKARILGM